MGDLNREELLLVVEISKRYVRFLEKNLARALEKRDDVNVNFFNTEIRRCKRLVKKIRYLLKNMTRLHILFANDMIV